MTTFHNFKSLLLIFSIRSMIIQFEAYSLPCLPYGKSSAMEIFQKILPSGKNKNKKKTFFCYVFIMIVLSPLSLPIPNLDST